MRQALGLFLVIVAVLLGADRWLGYGAAYEIGYGALALMGAMIAATFLWLWYERTTPLALGMAFSWAGAASVMGWWWIFNLLDRPRVMVGSEVLFAFLSLYFVGAVLHFSVMQRSLGLHGMMFALPLLGATLLSAVIHVLF
jgi:hypothetical protein